MEQQDTPKWRKKPQGSESQRKVDKELQRIKSLAVVSVLNKSFQDITPPLPPAMSPSSSLTTSSSEQSSPSYKARSRSVSSTSSTITKTIVNRPISTVHLPSHSVQKCETTTDKDKTPSLPTQPLPPPTTTTTTLSGQKDNSVAEKELSHDDLVTRSHIDEEKEVLQKRLAELQTLYDQSHQEADQLREQQKTQCQLLILQDKLIQEMTDHIEDLNTNSPVLDDGICHSETEEKVMALLPKAQEDLSWLQTELEQLMPLKTKYESFISDMTLQLKAYDQKADELETLAREIQKESRAQTLYIDAKVQALVNKVLERNEVISRLQYQMHTEKQLLPKIDNTSSISTKSAAESTHGGIWEQYTHEFSGGTGNSTRSSMASTDTAPSRIYTSRWKGNHIPPASPPPSLPLPPIPNSSVISRPKSIVSEVSEYSNTKSNKHVSIDAVGGSTLRRSSHQSEKVDTEMIDAIKAAEAMSVTEATSAAEAAYYKEFTEQLHARLSISKEIDDLRVWQPTDFEEIQKKLQSEYWPEISEKDQHAFWKGMKKKLRV
ncbi:hypothetical protein A0J61_04237 [Choanephora cucurbitarum]|uniref:Uncharacterized protein n=1 Tax=Choanephora cucurbitarum TaxID=101091 RepID=A0A1C7NF13_9FUNG|nr:hypothetical protein A0J61_04237 [Choanephora cucurbitarum]